MRMLVGVITAAAVAWPAAAEVTVGAFSSALAKNGQATAKAARQTLNSSMLDYPSARFRDVRAIAGPKGDVHFCGFVNGKNRMGAYTGWKEFAFSAGVEPTVYILPDDDIMVDIFCHKVTGSQDTRDWSADLTFR